MPESVQHVDVFRNFFLEYARPTRPDQVNPQGSPSLGDIPRGKRLRTAQREVFAVLVQCVTHHLTAWPGSTRLTGQNFALAARALQFLVLVSRIPPPRF